MIPLDMIRGDELLQKAAVVIKVDAELDDIVARLGWR